MIHDLAGLYMLLLSAEHAVLTRLRTGPGSSEVPKPLILSDPGEQRYVVGLMHHSGAIR